MRRSIVRNREVGRREAGRREFATVTGLPSRQTAIPGSKSVGRWCGCHEPLHSGILQHGYSPGKGHPNRTAMTRYASKVRDFADVGRTEWLKPTTTWTFIRLAGMDAHGDEAC